MNAKRVFYWVSLFVALLCVFPAKAVEATNVIRGGTITWKNSGTGTANFYVRVFYDLKKINSGQFSPIEQVGTGISFVGGSHTFIDYGAGPENISESDFTVTAINFLAGIVACDAGPFSYSSYDPDTPFTAALVGKNSLGEEVMRVETTGILSSGLDGPSFIASTPLPGLSSPCSGGDVMLNVSSQSQNFSVVATNASNYSINHPNATIGTGGGVSWATAGMPQVFNGIPVRVNAETLDSNDTPLSSSTIQFEVWINDPTSTIAPIVTLSEIGGNTCAGEINLVATVKEAEPSRVTLHAAFQLFEFDGTPVGSLNIPNAKFYPPQGPLAADVFTDFDFIWTAAFGSSSHQYVLLTITAEDEDHHMSAPAIKKIPLPLDISVVPVSNLQGNSPPTHVAQVDMISTFSLTVHGCSGVSIGGISNLPEWITVDPETGPADDDDTSRKYTFTCSPMTGDTTADFTLTIADNGMRIAFYSVRVAIDPLRFSAPSQPFYETSPGVALMFNVSGGYPSGSSKHFTLTATGLPSGAGFVEKDETGTSVSSSFSWLSPTAAVDPFVVTFTLTDVDASVTTEQKVRIYVRTLGAPPPWWTTREVLEPGAPVRDYAVANQGQLKALARKAYAEMLARYSQNYPLIGSDLDEMVTNSTAFRTDDTHNYAVATQGQAKALAQLFYDQLGSIEVAQKGVYPWSNSSEPAANYAPLTIGQLKKLFSFPVPPAP